MDYLQYIVNSFRVKHPHGQVKYSLIDMFDESKYLLEEVDFKQVNRIIGYVQDVLLWNKKIYGGSCEEGDRKKLYQMKLSEFWEKMEEEEILPSTMYHLIRMVESDSMRKVKNFLFQALFKSGNSSFHRLVKSSMEPIGFVELGGDDLILFGYGFRKYWRE